MLPEDTKARKADIEAKLQQSQVNFSRFKLLITHPSKI